VLATGSGLISGRRMIPAGHTACIEIRGPTANFPATRRILTGVTGPLASAVPDSSSDASLVHCALGGDVE